MDLMFIFIGLGRIDASVRRSLVPVVIKGIGKEWTRTATGGHTYSPSAPAIFNIFLRLLHELDIPTRGSKENDTFKETVGLEDPEDAEFLSEHIAKLLLLKPAALNSDTLRHPDVRNGLSEQEVEFFTRTGAEFWTAKDGQNLSETKTRAIKFIATSAFAENERLIPAICAAGSPDSRIRTVGDEILKHSTKSVEDPDLVERLFHLAESLPPAYQLSVMNLLSKSETACDPKYSKHISAIVERTFSSSAPVGFAGDEPDRSKAMGLLKSKIQNAVFAYLGRIAVIYPTRQPDFKLGTSLYMMVRTYIEDQGWPNPLDVLSAADIELRAKGYELIGTLGRSATLNMGESTSLVSWLFRSLSEDRTRDVMPSIENALSTLLTSRFRYQKGQTVNKIVRGLILNYMNITNIPADDDDRERALRSCRLAAVKWANNALPFSEPHSRWIDILAIGARANERSDVVEEGKKGLDPYYVSLSQGGDVEWPDWAELSECIFGNLIATASNFVWVHGTDASNTTKHVGGDAMETESALTDPAFTNFIDHSGDSRGREGLMGCLPIAVNYCMQMFFLAALYPEESDRKKLTLDWERVIEARLATDFAARRTVAEYVASATQPLQMNGLSLLLRAAYLGSTRVRAPTHAPLECLRVFVTLSSLLPAKSANLLLPFVKEADAGLRLELLELVRRGNARPEYMTLVARALGIVAAHPSVSDDTLKDDFLEPLAGPVVRWNSMTAVPRASPLATAEAQTALLALCHIVSRRVYYGVEGARQRAERVVQRILLPVFVRLPGLSPALQDTVFEGLAQLWAATIPGPIGMSDFEEKVLNPIVEHAKNSNERAILALGRLAFAGTDDERLADVDGDTAGKDDRKGKANHGKNLVDLVLEKLFALYEVKRAETHFAIGEAIAAAIACWDSDSVCLALDVDLKDETRMSLPSKRPKRIISTLDKLLADSRDTKPALLKASAIWLFAIAQACSRLPEVHGRLRECQAAFMRLLSARDAFVQETASRGLTLVYERGDTELRKTLVSDLVGAFTGTPGNGGPADRNKVDADTELFEPGALPTGDGQSVTSYRDIVQLANEVGDQSLVYKFMNLANNAATWSSRSAFGRFGLSSVLSETEVDPKLYVKLFRYRFDPNPNVQKSMEDIWKSVVKDPAATIDKYFDAIMTDLLESMWAQKEWRTRQASCLAIADLISGQPFAKYEKYYTEIWTRAAKVMDDVKMSVRNAAIQLCVGMSTTLVRQLEESAESAAAKAMTREALPFLLAKGIDSSVEEVKQVSVLTVLRIAKSGGSVLKPYIPDMVPALLHLLGTIDVQGINRAYIRADDESKEKLDKLRTSLVSQSPVSDAMDSLLRHVDHEVMVALAPRLEQTIKEAVALTTKLGCSRCLSILFTRNKADVQSFADRFLTLMQRQALDRNNEVSLEYAKAAAYVMRSATADAKIAFVDHFINVYFKAEDEARRQKAADAILALSKNSPDQFSALEQRLIPFAYLGSHDTDEYVRKALSAAWNAHAGFSSRTIVKFRAEILDLIRRALAAPQWPLQHAGALSVPGVVDAYAAAVQQQQTSGSDSSVSLTASDTVASTELWAVLEKALALKTFPDKEKVLAALPTFVKATGPSFWRDARPDVGAAMTKIALREARRNNDAYRPHAFAVLWRLARERPDVDLFGDVVGTVRGFLDGMNEGDWHGGGGGGGGGNGSSSTDKKTAAGSADATAKSVRADALLRLTAANAIDAMARSYNRPGLQSGGSTAQAVLRHVLDTATPYVARLSPAQRPPLARQLWFACVADLAKDAATVSPAAPDPPGPDSQEEGTALLKSYLATLAVGPEGVRAEIESTRAERARALSELLLATRRGAFGGGQDGGDAQVELVRAAAADAARDERSEVVRRALGEVIGT